MPAMPVNVRMRAKCGSPRMATRTGRGAANTAVSRAQEIGTSKETAAASQVNTRKESDPVVVSESPMRVSTAAASQDHGDMQSMLNEDVKNGNDLCMFLGARNDTATRLVLEAMPKRMCDWVEKHWPKKELSPSRQCRTPRAIFHTELSPVMKQRKHKRERVATASGEPATPSRQRPRMWQSIMKPDPCPKCACRECRCSKKTRSSM